MRRAQLAGRRVLITGAASGIGRVLAEEVIAADAKATLLDVNRDALASVASTGECDTVAMDVGDAAAWEALDVPESGWDFVALNAGVMTAPPDAPRADSDLLTMDLERYRRVMRVNVDGVLHGVRKVVPHLVDGGAIVVTASAAGLVAYGADVAYSMSKHAAVALVRGVAPLLDRIHKGQRICAICPGGVQTSIVPAAFEGMKMMAPSVIAAEITTLWLEGRNGDVKAKMRPELDALQIDEPELPPWW